MQAAIFGGMLWLWASDTSKDRPALGLVVVIGAFLAYTFTFCTLMLVEAVKEISRWRAKRQQRKIKAHP